MVKSRRHFIKTGTMACLAAALPGRAVAQKKSTPTSSPKGGMDPYEVTRLLKKDSFVQQLNTTFRISRGKLPAVDTTLVGVEEFEPGSVQEFFVRFRSPLTAVDLRQNTYIVEHSWLGRFALFIVPGGADAKGKYYVATFNRAIS